LPVVGCVLQAPGISRLVVYTVVHPLEVVVEEPAKKK
jgi:hypothetical protein